MKHLLAFLAAFALVVSPVAASAAAMGCAMTSGHAAMEGMGPSKPAHSGAEHGKACAAACALAGQAVCTFATPVLVSPFAHQAVRFSVAMTASPPGASVRADTPPPRTFA